jgi:LmbE family N-acetylglucosaminyl deacetylase/CheY-like chemotaxis protein
MTADTDKPRLSLVGEQDQGDRLHMLLVDGDDAAALALRRIVDRSSTARLAYVPDAQAAEALLQDGQWDLVVVDPVVPGGFELLRSVKARHRWLATMVMSRDQSPPFLRHAVKCQIDGLLFKPVSAQDFLEQALLLAEGVHSRRQRQQKRVLAIGAHPDDVEIGCGGALAKHQAKGDVLHILTMSRGAAGGDVNVRTAEAQRAASMLGAELSFGNLQDGHIGEGVETIEIIQDAVRRLRPTHVYTHCLEDTHQDHRAVHSASLVAARGVPNVYCYQTPSSTVEFLPNRFVDITDFIKQKLQVIGMYKSQVERMEAMHDDVILTNARYWGRYAGYVLAEPMRIVRQRDGDMTPDLGKQSAAARAALAG